MTTNIRNNRQAPTPRRHFAMTTLIISCVVMVTAGFFVAARQHFSSMDYGMKNSRMRKQVDQLEAEKRRLLLAREISLSPAEIKKAVKKIGLGEPASEKVTPALASAARPGATAPVKSLVEKTASVQPIRPVTTSSVAQRDRKETLTKKGTATETE
jgi:hypothetical protein